MQLHRVLLAEPPLAPMFFPFYPFLKPEMCDALVSESFFILSSSFELQMGGVWKRVTEGT